MDRAAFSDAPAATRVGLMPVAPARRFFVKGRIFPVKTALLANDCRPAARLGLPRLPAPIGAEPVRTSPANYHAP